MKHNAAIRRNLVAMGALLILARVAAAACSGDCDGDRQVTMGELVAGVDLAVGDVGVAACPSLEANGDDRVTVEELVPAVSNAQGGCPQECTGCDDADACTTDACVAGVCAHEPVSCPDDGRECTAESCERTGGCTSRAVADGTLCQAGAGSCRAGDCVLFECQSPGDCEDGDACTIHSCVDHACSSSAVSCPDDGNECTASVCDRVSGCSNQAVANGVSCQGGAGSCQSGACVRYECLINSDCNDQNACTTDACIDRACVRGAVTCQDDGNPCTAESCDPQLGCRSTNVADGLTCNGDGTCQAGTCVVSGVTQYSQSFEGLNASAANALSADGWVVFGNVFDGSNGRYLYGYGAFPAPNGTSAFCAIDKGQGGSEQGQQQLSIYSDYNNMDHAKGHRIESLVFRERVITAADVGQTITFSFDAKRGNINNPADPLCPCASTATAFLKTLNPAAGFATTNLVKVDTTALPETWSRYSVSLKIEAPLVNQRLQVGFSAVTTRYQPSGVYYDNVRVASAPTLP